LHWHVVEEGVMVPDISELVQARRVGEKEHQALVKLVACNKRASTAYATKEHQLLIKLVACMCLSPSVCAHDCSGLCEHPSGLWEHPSGLWEHPSGLWEHPSGLWEHPSASLSTPRTPMPASLRPATHTGIIGVSVHGCACLCACMRAHMVCVRET